MEKWFFGFAAIAFVAMFGSLAYAEKEKSQCRIAGINKSLTAEQIDVICK